MRLQEGKKREKKCYRIQQTNVEYSLISSHRRDGRKRQIELNAKKNKSMKIEKKKREKQYQHSLYLFFFFD